MKKIIPILFLFAFASANAANMCVRDDVMMVVLDPQIGGTALSSEATGKTWSTSFSYGVISGIAACSSSGGSKQGGLSLDQSISPYTTGSFCHCKMLRPVPSAWVYRAIVNNCSTNCASNCSSYAGSSIDLRKGLFGSIGN